MLLERIDGYDGIGRHEVGLAPARRARERARSLTRRSQAFTALQYSVHAVAHDRPTTPRAPLPAPRTGPIRGRSWCGPAGSTCPARGRSPSTTRTAGRAERWWRAGPLRRRDPSCRSLRSRAASGVGDTGYHHVAWYRRDADRRRLAAAGHCAGDRLVLRFGAVDFRCQRLGGRRARSGRTKAGTRPSPST